MVWWINKHKHSISNVFIARVISFYAFWKFLRLGNSAWDFSGVNFRSRNFGGFWESCREFFGFWFLAPFDHPRHLKSGVPPSPWGSLIYLFPARLTARSLLREEYHSTNLSISKNNLFRAPWIFEQKETRNSGDKRNVFNINELLHTLLSGFTLISKGTNKMMSLRYSSNDLPLIWVYLQSISPSNLQHSPVLFLSWVWQLQTVLQY